MTKELSSKSVIDKQKIWNLEGPFDSNYSLAILNRNFAKGLIENDYIVRLYSTEGPGDYDPNQDFLEAYPKILNMYKETKIFFSS